MDANKTLEPKISIVVLIDRYGEPGGEWLDGIVPRFEFRRSIATIGDREEDVSIYGEERNSTGGGFDRLRIQRWIG